MYTETTNQECTDWGRGGVGAWGHGGVMPPQFPGKFKKVGHVARNVACIGKLEQILICNLVYSAGHS